MTMNANQPTENVTPAPVGSGHLVRRLEAHAQTLAEILAECAGYLASVRTDRQVTHHEELYALQTVEWAEGAVEIAEKILDNHAIQPHWARNGEQIAVLLAEAAREGYHRGARDEARFARGEEDDL